MAHSFFVPQASNTIENYTAPGNHFYHEASGTHYEMVQRDGKFFQRRHQAGFDGKDANIDEKQIDYVMGSGAHARTYLHRTAQGALVQLPLGWYSENGWAMSPGYDTAQHPGAQRPIGYDCMFCHNAYPPSQPVKDRFGDTPRFAAKLPEGIDCARCHGSGQRHIAAAQKQGDVRGTIVNPARLTLERQAEVCMQCHLQPNSLRPTHNFKLYDRGWFSYQPGEPLSSFMVFFDSPPAGDAERFQIAGSAYRLRQSACFLKSAGALQCTSCHNPHEDTHAGALKETYDKACLKCHTGAFQTRISTGRHTSQGGCAACHMPKRRTADVVHVVMTDHRIVRRPAADLLAKRAEMHDAPAKSPVGVYYPKAVATSAASRLMLAVAQVRDRANTSNALLRLLRTEPPAIPDPFFEAADAERAAGHLREAVPLYGEAIRRDPRYTPALLGLGMTLHELGELDQAAETLRKATAAAPGDADMWAALGRVEVARGKPVQAKSAFEKALALEPDAPTPHIGLGVLLAQTGSLREAESEFREAIRIHPNAGESHGYLANLLIAERDLNQASWEFERATRLSPQDVALRLRYAGLLYTLNQAESALHQVDAALGTNPSSAEAHHMRGNIQEQQGRVPEALHEYTEAVRLDPKMSRAQLDLGAVLAQTGDKAGAIVHLKLAATSEEENVRRIALQSLAELGAK